MSREKKKNESKRNDGSETDINSARAIEAKVKSLAKSRNR